MEENRLNWKLRISNTADNADIAQSQARDTRHRLMQEVNSLCIDSGPLPADYCMWALHTIQASIVVGSAAKIASLPLSNLPESRPAWQGLCSVDVTFFHLIRFNACTPIRPIWEYTWAICSKFSGYVCIYGGGWGGVGGVHKCTMNPASFSRLLKGRRHGDRFLARIGENLAYNLPCTPEGTCWLAFEPESRSAFSHIIIIWCVTKEVYQQSVGQGSAFVRVGMQRAPDLWTWSRVRFRCVAGDLTLTSFLYDFPQFLTMSFYCFCDGHWCGKC